MIVRPAVQGSITSEDSALLDEVEAELPEANEVRLANEFTKERRENEDGSETLSARMTFIDDIQGKAAAEYLFSRVQDHPITDGEDYSLRLYETPEGGVTVDAVREWYEMNSDKQPTDEDGEAYIPSRFNPENHIMEEI